VEAHLYSGLRPRAISGLQEGSAGVSALKQRGYSTPPPEMSMAKMARRALLRILIATVFRTGLGGGPANLRG